MIHRKIRGGRLWVLTGIDISTAKRVYAKYRIQNFVNR